LLAIHHAIISGSCALRLLLPQKDVFWKPDDLDIYVCEREAPQLLNTLLAKGYRLISQTAKNGAQYPPSHVHSIRTLRRHTTQIDVIVSNSTTAISPIFEFHSTILMNFVTAHSVFCAYPHLTLRELSIINPFVAYRQPLQRSTLAALVKYTKR
ncbi:hypothetical protein EDD15DRAFT_2146855, partial [Pisolithus albus]